MSVEAVIAQYGYTAIFIGAVLEGETVLLIAAVLVQQGMLDFKSVLLASAAGAFAGDQFFFHLGHLRGGRLLRRRAAWQGKLDRAWHWLGRRRVVIILFYRFIYGMRAVIPFLLGSSGMCRVHIFTLLSAASALAWATIIGGGGYLFGAAFQCWIIEGRSFQRGGVLCIALAVASVGGWRWWQYRRHGTAGKKACRGDVVKP
jgi:membrane protein DedA with SNARE-associated domain